MTIDQPMTISIIVAASENNVIGKDNDLVWHLPTDMKFFKDTTTGHCVIMGRKNYDSIPEKYRPLAHRTNIIITRQKDFNAPGCIVVASIDKAIQKAQEISDNEIFIIGGAQIYSQSMDIADKIYLTRVHHTFEGDAFFPKLDSNKWKQTDSKVFKADEKNKYDFTIYTYQKQN